MNQKNTFKKITILLIIIALTSTCTIVTACNHQHKITPEFANSLHYQKYIIKHQIYLNYNETPTHETIIDYIFTQSPQIIKKPDSTIFTYVKNTSGNLITHQIAYSRELTQNEITKYQNLKNFTTQNTIAKNLHSLPDDDILIAKTPETNNHVGVFINIKSLKTIEPELKNGFISINTLTDIEYHSFIRTFLHRETVDIVNIY